MSTPSKAEQRLIDQITAVTGQECDGGVAASLNIRRGIIVGLGVGLLAAVLISTTGFLDVALLRGAVIGAIAALGVSLARRPVYLARCGDEMILLEAKAGFLGAGIGDVVSRHPVSAEWTMGGGLLNVPVEVDGLRFHISKAAVPRFQQLLRG